MTMTYTQFEDEFIAASVIAADSDSAANPRSHGVVDAFLVARRVLPDVTDAWVRSAVESFEMRSWIFNVSRALRGGIGFMITGEGRRHAESLG